MNAEELRHLLNDSVRWIETRHMLYLGAELVGPTSPKPLAGVVLHRDSGTATVIGHPPRESIETVASAATELIAFPENYHLVGAAVPEWFGELVTLFNLPETRRLADPKLGDVRRLAADEISRLPLSDPALRAELHEAAREGATIFASLEDGAPAAFCYDASATETLWDIGVDTVEGHRRKGHAYRCVSAAIRYWLERGKSPRWAAGESNFVSRRLARKLGFRPVDAMVIFEPGAAIPGPDAA